MQRRLAPIALIIVSALAASPLFLNPGFLNTRGGGDSPFLLFRLHQLYSALTQGVFPARWMPDAAFGLGYPFFNYYAALPLYLAAAFKLLGASYVLALKLTHLTGFIFAAIGMYGWMRSIGTTRLAAWTAAAAYTFAPFHLVNVYVRGDSLNEFFAFALYPICLWAARRLADQPSLPRGLPLTFAYAALILTHNVSALIFSPFLGLYILAISVQRSAINHNSLRAIVHCSLFIAHCSLSIALGLALSSFFWLPALRETGFAQLGAQTTGYFHYSNHFRGWDLVQPSLLFNFDVGSDAATPFAMGLAQALLAAIGLLAVSLQLLAALRRKDPSFITCPRQGVHPSSFAIAGLIISTFMITRFSEPLWANLPLLPFVQFPWRFLSAQSLFASALIGLALSNQQSAISGQRSVISNHAPRPTLIAPLAITISALCILPTLLPLRPDFIPLADSDITAERLQTYEYFTGNIGATIRYEYLPKWTQPRPYSSEEYIFGAATLKALNGEAEGERLDKRAHSQTWRITVHSGSASVAAPLLYWPGWQARADGQPLDIRPADGLGWIAFDLPRGDHTVELQLGDTPIRRAGNIVSLIALLATAIVAQPHHLLKSISALSASLRLKYAALSIAVAAALIAISIIARALNARAQPSGAATMDFDQQGYLHSDAAPFSNGDILQGYNYSAESLRPGDLFGIALQWQGAGNATFAVDLVSPAGHLLDLPRTFASAGGAARGLAGVSFRIPDDIATGVYLLRLTLTQNDLPAPALTFNHQPRGPLYLRPIRILQPPNHPTTQPPNHLTPSIALLSAAASQTDSASVAIALHWQATAPVPANYVLALRLRDGTGFELAALDIQPTGGVYPASAWRVGEIVPDIYHFDLPLGLPPGDYPLTLTLYDAATAAAAGAVTVPVRLGQWTPPPGTEPLHRFTDALALHDVSLPGSARAGDQFTLTAQWTSLAALSQNFIARWSAVSPNGEVSAVADHPLAVIPTSQWAAGALVMGRPSLALPITAPAGEYTLNVQLLDPSGELLSPPVAVGKVAVTPSDRTTTLPPMQFESGDSFGSPPAITLAGYDAAISGDTLNLTLYWQQSSAMTADYKYFIHLFHPADEFIAAQADGFPIIPTSQWQKNEVVIVSASLPLADLESKTVYNIGVGWYDPNTGARLGQRVILSQGVAKP